MGNFVKRNHAIKYDSVCVCIIFICVYMYYGVIRNLHKK